jgi:hypothetical protein
MEVVHARPRDLISASPAVLIPFSLRIALKYPPGVRSEQSYFITAIMAELTSTKLNPESHIILVSYSAHGGALI